MDRGGLGVSALNDGHDDDLHRRQSRRHHDSLIVTVGHHHTTHQSGGDSPRRVPSVLILPLHALELEVELFREVLAEEVGSAGLKSSIVLHQCLAGVAPHCSRELLGLGLQAS